MKVQLLRDDAILPQRANQHAAGYDLRIPTDQDLVVGLNKVHLGFAIEIPTGHYGRIACRSSLAKAGMSVEAGVVDEDYRGEVIVLLRIREALKVERGWKIAQMIITPYASPEIELVANLSKTQRGSGGFGSTGK